MRTKKITIVLFFLFSINVQAQKNQQPYLVASLFFEDNIGNKDTLYFGFDSLATFYIDTIFNESNIINIPINPLFEIRFTDENHQPNPYGTATHTFHSKKQILDTDGPYETIEYSYNEQIAEIDIICQNWPIYISWDSSLFDNLFKQKILLTNWDPPGGWFDASNGCSSQKKYLKDSNSLLLNETENCTFNLIDINNVSFLANKLYIGLDYTILNIEYNYNNYKLQIFPNPASNVLNFTSLEKIQVVKIYNLTGQIIFENNIGNEFGDIDISKIEDGIYYLYIFINNKIIIKKFVKI